MLKRKTRWGPAAATPMGLGHLNPVARSGPVAFKKKICKLFRFLLSPAKRRADKHRQRSLGLFLVDQHCERVLIRQAERGPALEVIPLQRKAVRKIKLRTPKVGFFRTRGNTLIVFGESSSRT